MENTFTLLRDYLDAFTSKIADFNKRLARYNYPQVTFTTETSLDDHNLLNVILNVPALYVPEQGVNFVATVSLLEMEDDSRIISSSREDVAKILKECKLECDHCHTERARGKYLVFIKDSAKDKAVIDRNDLVIVGTRCAHDYFGFNIANFIESVSSELEELDDYCSGYSNHVQSMDILATAVATVTDSFRKSYVSRKASMENDSLTATISLVNDFLFDSKVRNAYDIPEFNPDWIERTYAKYADEGNDIFHNNIHTLLYYSNGERRTLIDNKYTGIIVYALYSSQVNEKKEHKAGDFVGTIGEKITFTASIVKRLDIDTAFGCSTLLILTDDKGNTLKTFTTSKVLQLDNNVPYKFMATVKGQDEYKGIRQTTVTRIKQVA